MADDVSLTDLEVIQRYSLAVRGATAPRADLVAALQADLAWLTGRRVRLEGDAVDEGDPTPRPAAYRVVPGGQAGGAAPSSSARS